MPANEIVPFQFGNTLIEAPLQPVLLTYQLEAYASTVSLALPQPTTRYIKHCGGSLDYAFYNASAVALNNLNVQVFAGWVAVGSTAGAGVYRAQSVVGPLVIAPGGNSVGNGIALPGDWIKIVYSFDVAIGEAETYLKIVV